NISICSFSHDIIDNCLCTWIFPIMWIHIPMDNFVSHLFRQLNNLFIKMSTRCPQKLYIFVAQFVKNLFCMEQILTYLFDFLIKITFISVAEHTKFMFSFRNFF